ncbi:MAG TPA: sigma-70 family RNA polymerase sigma factor [Gracilimonas sp.]|uniref:RNA polymerase sigma factor n=1 Tax=Gracilimonas sp. TaxID=1974203 RepID=UPI002DA17965|nr:sigma-70 family RNA polymerase sigma factor [Gracilimonas sp.]
MKLTKRHVDKPDYKELKDRDLVKFFRKNGDESAFNELMNRHQQKIYSYIYSMVMNPEIANDLFQTTFTKVITKMDDTYNEQGKWIAWVMRIAHNATIDYLRKQKRYIDVSGWSDEDSSTDYFDRMEDDSVVDADDKMIETETRSSLMKHIAKLPEEQRSVVLLRHYYEMPFKEIAELTDVSINTALGRMRYALINLRKYFEEEREEEHKHAHG